MKGTSSEKTYMPVKTGEIIDTAISLMEEKRLFERFLDSEIKGLLDEIKENLPEGVFPDVYLEQPILGDAFIRAGIGFTLDDQNLTKRFSDNNYFAENNIPLLDNYEDEFGISGLIIDTEGKRAFCENSDLPNTICVTTIPEEIVQRLGNLGARYRVRRFDENTEILFTAENLYLSGSRRKNAAKQQNKEIIKFLTDLGCPGEKVEALEVSSFRLGIPFYSKRFGYSYYAAVVGPCAYRLIYKDRKLFSCGVILKITDKCHYLSGLFARDYTVHQWHITDECDQRCKHCYLFGEDASKKCLSTPWDQLMRTLDSLEEDAVNGNALPFLAISGGDPILHPRFWDFAKELHSRGYRWSIMGNPFHLTPEVCMRLRKNGVVNYQLSLDGLEPFHDYLRKKGSFKATLKAMKYLMDAGIETQFMATVSRQNMEDVLKCMDLAAEVGVDKYVFARYCATARDKVEELYSTPEEYRDFLLRYYRKKREYERQGCHTRFIMKDHLFTLLRWELGDFEVSEYSRRNPEKIMDGCHLGQGIVILANGDMMACRRMESIIGNIRDMSIEEAENSEACKAYVDVSEIEKCKDCELLNWCRGCRAVGYNATGNLQSADPMCWKK